MDTVQEITSCKRNPDISAGGTLREYLLIFLIWLKYQQRIEDLHISWIESTIHGHPRTHHFPLKCDDIHVDTTESETNQKNK